MAGPWLATHIWEYYDYTRDVKFLKEIGYELIKSSANFAVDYLWHKPDGTYTAAPSTSPEHGSVDQGATFVHAVVREILLDAIDASKVLRVDAKERKYWEQVLEKLVPYKIGRYGLLGSTALFRRLYRRRKIMFIWRSWWQSPLYELFGCGTVF